MTKRENPRRKEREFNKFQERSNRGFRKKDENQKFDKKRKHNFYAFGNVIRLLFVWK